MRSFHVHFKIVYVHFALLWFNIKYLCTHLEDFSLFKIAMPNTGPISLIHSIRFFINKTPTVLISLREVYVITQKIFFFVKVSAATTLCCMITVLHNKCSQNDILSFFLLLFYTFSSLAFLRVYVTCSEMVLL